MKKNRIIYIMTLLFLGTLNYYFNSLVMDIVFYCTLSIIPLAWLSILVTKLSLDIDLELRSNKLVKKEASHIKIKIHNISYLITSPVIIKIRNDYGLKIEREYEYINLLLPKEVHIFEINFRGDFRGEYKIGLGEITIRDHFNIFQFKYKNVVQEDIVIYPKIVDMNQLNIRKSIAEEKNTYSIDAIEQDVMVDIRNYQYGDPLKKIHWKLSAKNNNLMVKKYNTNMNVNCNVILDLSYLKNMDANARLAIEDKLIEVAISISFHALHNNMTVTLFSGEEDKHLFEIKDISDFERLYNDLAKIPFDSKINFESIVKRYYEENEMKDKNDFNNTFVLTNRPTKELYGVLADYPNGANNFNLYYVFDRNVEYLKSMEVVKRMNNIGIIVKRIIVEDEFNTI